MASAGICFSYVFQVLAYSYPWCFTTGLHWDINQTWGWYLYFKQQCLFMLFLLDFTSCFELESVLVFINSLAQALLALKESLNRETIMFITYYRGKLMWVRWTIIWRDLESEILHNWVRWHINSDAASGCVLHWLAILSPRKSDGQGSFREGCPHFVKGLLQTHLGQPIK